MSFDIRNKREKQVVTFAAAAIIGMLGLFAVTSTMQQASATHQPADKIAVSGATTAMGTTQADVGNSSAEFVLMSATLKTSSPTDLIITHSQESALLTDIKLSSKNANIDGVTTADATAHVEVWVEIDGNPVPVTAGDDGTVVFNDRTYYMSTNVLSQIQDLCAATNTTCSDSFINTYISTKSSHAFTWVALNVGSGVHTVEVKAKVVAEVNGDGEASVFVEKRTLVVTPAKLANDATI